MRAVVILLEDHPFALQIEQLLPPFYDGEDLFPVPLLGHWATKFDVWLAYVTVLELLVHFFGILVKDELRFPPYSDHRPNRELGSRRSPSFLYTITTVPFVRVADHPIGMMGVLVEMAFVRKIYYFPLPFRPLVSRIEIHPFL